VPFCFLFSARNVLRIVATMPDESELIADCQRGDAEAWDELFDAHYAAAGRFIFQLSADLSREDADEICQEVFLSVIKNIGTFKRGSQFRTWLFRIATNKARDFLEHRRAAKRGGGHDPLSLNAEDENGRTIDPPDPLPAPDASLLSNEQMLLVRQALDQLGDPCREIIELRYFGDLSYDEISGELDLNPKTVSSRLSKCLGQLEKIARPLFFRTPSPHFPV
jgi:RNA polymerase sigma-70 factor (ECF subfamily)